MTRAIPFEPSSRFEIARCHMRLGHSERALQSLESAVQFGFQQAGASHQLLVQQNSGHEYPTDHVRVLKDALSFVLAK